MKFKQLPTLTAATMVFGLLAGSHVRAADLPTWIAPDAPSVGVRTVALADAGVRRPTTTPCVVELIGRHDFRGGDLVPLTYTPPAACPGPWAKVVIEADFDVAAGRQFDRSAAIHLGGVNLYYGTTMEPRRDIAPAWRVERDVTEEAALLSAPQTGAFLLANVVDGTYTSPIHASARLLFYPLAPGEPAPSTAQLVLPLSDSAQRLSAETPAFSKTVVFPTNVERLYLDVIAEPQGDDEFWYGCVPDRLASQPEERCGGGPFREVEVRVDGRTAGVAPIVPWIYTGGINPYLWFPIPAPETLNFTPSRIDLTPFAGLVDDGRPHRIELRIDGVRAYVLATASLRVWRDPGASRVTGGLIRNTLAAAAIETDDQGARVIGKGLDGRVRVRASRKAAVAGYVMTSHGRVETDLSYDMDFDNTQTFEGQDTRPVWTLRQSTLWRQETRIEDASGVRRSLLTQSFPLTIESRKIDRKDGAENLDSADLSLIRRQVETGADGATRTRDIDNRVVSQAHGQFDSAARRFIDAAGSSRQTYRLQDSREGCYARTITTVGNAVTQVETGCPPAAP